MTTMVEKVARALAFNEGGRMIGRGQNNATRQFGWEGDGVHFEKYAEAHWKEHVGAAVMAIAALREPTVQMVNAAWYDYEDSSKGVLVEESSTCHSPDCLSNDTAYEVWQAMIDGALNELRPDFSPETKIDPPINVVLVKRVDGNFEWISAASVRDGEAVLSSMTTAYPPILTR